MLIRKEHAKALLNLLQREQEGHGFLDIDPINEDEHIELDLANLVALRSPLRYSLTYWGRLMAYLLDEMISNGVLPHPDEWPDDWRWIGSEVLTMIESAKRNGDKVSYLTEEALNERGFVEVRKEKKKGIFKVINDYAQRVWEIYRGAHPKLVIGRDLYDYVRKIPEGPSPSKNLLKERRFAELLESMRLVALSVPKREIYTFTGLGQAVKRMMEYVAPARETLLSEDLMVLLARYMDEGWDALSESERAVLMALALVSPEGELLPAGEYALEAYNLWKGRQFKPVKTISIDLLDAEILKTLESLWKKYEQNPDLLPTVDEIINELFYRPIKEYKHLLSYYGRRIYQDVGYHKKKEIEKKFAEVKTVEELFKSFYERGGKWRDKMKELVLQSLYSLESFDLVFSSHEKGKEIYRITEHGRGVLNDMHIRGFRDIPSEAVKSITISYGEFIAPNGRWYDEALKRNLVSVAGPTESGRFYAQLSYEIVRKPHLTKFELQVLKSVPEQGFFLRDVYDSFDEIWHEEITYALNKLEARGYLYILPDEGIVLTDTGRKIKRALAGAPDSMINPITPITVRLLKALAEVGTLYVKERKIRILPRNIKEAIKRSGLEPELFRKTMLLARAAGLVGQNSLTEAGILVLQILREEEREQEVRYE
ncbi:MAG: DUF505 domain-containing protein [Thermotogae bacterium]|nr:DUF505 domain-containing protein [Thermotogota bacterium]